MWRVDTDGGGYRRCLSCSPPSLLVCLSVCFLLTCQRVFYQRLGLVNSSRSPEDERIER